jgi:hypothetical protein
LRGTSPMLTLAQLFAVGATRTSEDVRLESEKQSKATGGGHPPSSCSPSFQTGPGGPGQKIHFAGWRGARAPDWQHLYIAIGAGRSRPPQAAPSINRSCRASSGATGFAGGRGASTIITVDQTSVFSIHSVSSQASQRAVSRFRLRRLHRCFFARGQPPL